MASLDIHAFTQCKVLDEEGREVPLSSFWKKHTALFIFLRHFGCIACRSHAAEIWHHRERYQKNGAKIIFIGNGKSQYIKAFKEDLDLEGASIYTDPELKCFQAAGFKRGFLKVFSPASAINAAKLAANGHRQALSKGDLWQLGGMMVVKANGKVAYHYISEAVGDYPPEKDVIT